MALLTSNSAVVVVEGEVCDGRLVACVLVSELSFGKLLLVEVEVACCCLTRGGGLLLLDTWRWLVSELCWKVAAGGSGSGLLLLDTSWVVGDRTVLEGCCLTRGGDWCQNCAGRLLLVEVEAACCCLTRGGGYIL